MGKKGKIGYLDMSESSNWNVAADYVKIKLMKWLYYADEYELIATFGTSEMVEEFMTDEESKKMARISALERLTKTLELIINNTIFAVKKDDKKLFKRYRESIQKIKKLLPLVKSERIDQRRKISKIIEINEASFQAILDVLIHIKTEINDPLNKADLIFTSIDDATPEELMEKYEEEMKWAG